MRLHQPTAVIVSLAILLPAFTWAAERPDQILRNQQQQLEQQREELLKRPDVFIQPLTVPPEHPSGGQAPEAICFNVDNVALQGVPDAWLLWLMPLVQVDQGKCLGLSKVNAIVVKLTNAIVERGYVTSRVYLPEQDLSSGTLRLVVVPGKLREIRLKEGGDDLSLRSAFPTGPGDILNVRDLEQGLEQLSRARSQRATMEIVPAEQQAESDVVVVRERTRPVAAVLSVDDSGQKPTGKLQSSTAITIDGLAGMNDVLSLLWSQDARHLSHPLSQADTVSWLFPFGNWTAFASYSEFSFSQTVMGVNQNFTSTGHSRNTLLSLSRLLHRDQNSKTELALQLTRKASRNFIEDTEIRQQRRDLTNVGLDLSHRHYLGSTVLDAGVGFIRGVSWWGAQEDTLAAEGGPTSRQEVFTGRLSLAVPFRAGKANLRWTSDLRGQYSPHLLYSSEQFSIGSRYTVRGFDTNSLTGQSGAYLRNELSWSVVPPADNGTSLEAYVGLDAGEVSRAIHPDADTHSLSGWAVGMRGAISSWLSAELSHEQAIHQPTGWSRPSITHFRLALQW